MRATIIADASHCPDTLAGGYAFWIASDRGKFGGSGAMRDSVATNNCAEMMALTIGLYTAIRDKLVQEGDVVLLQTDCMAAIDAFEGKRNNMPKQEIVVLRYLQELVTSAQIRVQFRHVKGHTKGTEPRYFINNQCDRLAKRAMRKLRDQIRKALK